LIFNKKAIYSSIGIVVFDTREFVKIIVDRKTNEFVIGLYFRMIEKMTVFEDKVIVGILDRIETEFRAGWNLMW